MTTREKLDHILTGISGGIILPLIVAVIVYLSAKGSPPVNVWIERINQANIATHIVSLCVFPNLFIFLIFNYFDMLKASRGVLAVTIVWAVIVFCVKFLL